MSTSSNRKPKKEEKIVQKANMLYDMWMDRKLKLSELNEKIETFEEKRQKLRGIQNEGKKRG
jgi:hypothetical protein